MTFDSFPPSRLSRRVKYPLTVILAMAKIHLSRHIPVLESVAKSIKALNHEDHEGKEKLFFVVPFFSEAFATPSKAYLLVTSLKPLLCSPRAGRQGVGNDLSPLSFPTGIVRNPLGRDSHLSGHSPPCGVDPVQSMYGMTEGALSPLSTGIARPPSGPVYLPVPIFVTKRQLKGGDDR